MENILGIVKNFGKEIEFDNGKGENTNLFFLLNIEHNEVLICRLLSSIISPYNNFGLSINSLQLFCENVLSIKNEFNDKDYENAKIFLEEKIDNDRRVDIVIYIGQKVVPIEVKVFAKDQESQLFDYYEYYSSNKNCNKIYYLTINGKEPSVYSLSKGSKNLLKDNYKCISFTKSISEYLKEISKLGTNAESGIIIEWFQKVIEEMSKEDNILNEIDKATSELDKESIKSVLNVLTYKEKIWEAIKFHGLNNSIKKYGYRLEKEGEGDKFSFDNNYFCSILKEEKCLGYIFIDTNIYIVKSKNEFINEKSKDGWTPYPNGEYFWKYLETRKKKKWPLKSVDLEFTDNIEGINWEDYIE